LGKRRPPPKVGSPRTAQESYAVAWAETRDPTGGTVNDDDGGRQRKRAAAPHHVVALVASAGGLDAVEQVFAGLPAEFHAMAVVLSGMGSDGADGARTLTGLGAVVIAQDEETSAFFAMPHAAIETGGAKALPVGEIAAALCELVTARA